MPRHSSKRKVHRFFIALQFNTECEPSVALWQAREALHDLHFTDPEFDGPWFRVKSIRMRRRGDEVLPRQKVPHPTRHLGRNKG